MTIKINLTIPIILCVILFFILLIFKLADAGLPANWSWVWITSPLWGGAVAVGLFIIICVAWAARHH